MKIIIVDDHVLFREGLASIMRQEPDLEVVDLVGTVQEAILAVKKLRPDIVLMDFRLPDGVGTDAAYRITREVPESKIIFLTMSDNDEHLFAAIRCGAKGYLLKNISPSKLIAALKSVQQGESALSRSMTLRLMSEFARTKEPEDMGQIAFAKLTRREKEVLAELVNGKSNKEIARQFILSENTIKYHVHSILEKINLPDRKELARFGKEHGLK
jgi:DNA-binding NarL/FixJ family response regulator